MRLVVRAKLVDIWDSVIIIMIIIIIIIMQGGADGRVVKVLDSQPRDRGFESRHTLGLLCLKSLGKICTLNVPSGDREYANACLSRNS